jgi:broad specificity phosphatase PhoE
MTGEPAPRIRFVFVRHGVAMGADGRCVGHTDLPLSPRGAADIRVLSTRIARAVHGTPRVVTSDLRRAVDSAAIIARELCIDVDTNWRLREMDFGDWDGRSWAELGRDDDSRLRHWTDHWEETAPPGGESLDHLASRVTDWLHVELARTIGHDRTVVVVAHGGSIRVAVSLLLGKSLRQLFTLPIDHARATIVDRDSSGARLVVQNVDDF